jgi:hypothetical protein
MSSYDMQQSPVLAGIFYLVRVIRARAVFLRFRSVILVLAHLSLPQGYAYRPLWITDVTGEGVGGVIGDEHAETGHSVRVENPPATPPVADRDHGALAAAVDTASLHGATFLLAIRQVMRPVHFWQLRHYDLSSPWWYLPAVRAVRQGGRPAELRSAPLRFISPTATAPDDYSQTELTCAILTGRCRPNELVTDRR